MDEAPHKHDGLSLDGLQAKLEVCFADCSLLERALTHPSYLNERSDLDLVSNERLEFLGDAILGLVVAETLYERLPDAAEGDLTRRRAALVRRDTLAAAATRLGLGEALRVGRGERTAGGHRRPRALAAAFEAVVAAIARDQGLEAARTFVLRALADDIERTVAADAPLDAKSRLQQWLQARGQSPPVYRVVVASGSGHEPQFVVQVVADGAVVGEAGGSSKRRAEEAAASAALARLAGDAGFDEGSSPPAPEAAP